MPDNYQIWYSEFGEVKLTAEDTWAAGVRYAAFNYGLLNLGSKADIFGYHHITDNNVIKVNDNDETQMRFASIGIATKLLMKARAEMTKM